jgi:hypothetical protein
MKNRNEVRISMILNIHIAGREINIEKRKTMCRKVMIGRERKKN